MDDPLVSGFLEREGLTPADGIRAVGEAPARAVPAGGLVDVHTYAVATLAGRDVILDVTFPGPPWDGVSDMPVAAAAGRDVPAGPDAAATKAALVRAHCDPAVREPFIAALSGSGPGT
jgi:hypothetical protein